MPGRAAGYRSGILAANCGRQSEELRRNVFSYIKVNEYPGGIVHSMNMGSGSRSYKFKPKLTRWSKVDDHWAGILCYLGESSYLWSYE